MLTHSNIPKIEIKRTAITTQTQIEFLTLAFRGEVLQKLKSPPIVIYAGAAPGNHIPFLSFLFPFVKFICVDPRPFAIQETARIEIQQRMFTDDYARAAPQSNSNRLVLFISDIRCYRCNVYMQLNSINQNQTQYRKFVSTLY